MNSIRNRFFRNIWKIIDSILTLAWIFDKIHLDILINV